METNVHRELTRDKIYLAGPFFNQQQVADQERIEKLCEKHCWSFFSPRLECLITPESSLEERRRTFFMNVHAIRNARLVLANVEGFDTGTIWEMGGSYFCNRKTVIYSPNPQRKLNLMLVQGADGFLAGWDAIEAFLTPKDEKNFCWGAADSSWEKEVF